MSSVTVYHFWSPTCNPCKVIKPAMESMKEDFEDKIVWKSVNTREDPDGFARKFNVSVVPTVVVTKGDQVVGMHSGANVGIYYTLIRKGLALA